MGGQHCNNSNSSLPRMKEGLVDRGMELEVDIESGNATSEDDGSVSVNNQSQKLVKSFWNRPLCSSKLDDVANETADSQLAKSSETEESRNHLVKNVFLKEKQKQKKKETRKAQKPPRPPQGPLLDAADEKLVQEIAELARRKRARVERIKMLKKTRAAKSSACNFTLWAAMVVTVIFFIIIIFQGICARSKAMSLHGSPEPAIGAKQDMIAIEFFDQTSDGPGSSSPNFSGRASFGFE